MSAPAVDLNGRQLEDLRNAWKSSLPDDEDVTRAARRIATAMRRQQRRGKARRRSLVLASAAILMLGALAYAASGTWKSEQSPSTERVRTQKATVQAPFTPEKRRKNDPSVSRADSPRKAPNPISAGPASPPKTTPAPQLTDRANAKAAPEPVGQRGAEPTEAKWRDVGQALALDDTSRAKRALTELSKNDDPSTRAKAMLGLAKLELSRGNHARALRLAREVTTMTEIGASLRARAHRVVERASK